MVNTFSSFTFHAFRLAREVPLSNRIQIYTDFCFIKSVLKILFC